MSASIESRLAATGILLPDLPPAVGAYAPFLLSGTQLFISGQLPAENGALKYKGHLGRDVSLENGQAAAQLCALNILAQARAACGGSLNRLHRCLKLTGYVASTPDFIDHPKVINGASELLLAAMGESGHHTRAAVGVASLPLGAAVEIEALFEVLPA